MPLDPLISRFLLTYISAEDVDLLENGDPRARPVQSLQGLKRLLEAAPPPGFDAGQMAQWRSLQSTARAAYAFAKTAGRYAVTPRAFLPAAAADLVPGTPTRTRRYPVPSGHAEAYQNFLKARDPAEAYRHLLELLPHLSPLKQAAVASRVGDLLGSLEILELANGLRSAVLQMDLETGFGPTELETLRGLQTKLEKALSQPGSLLTLAVDPVLQRLTGDNRAVDIDTAYHGAKIRARALFESGNSDEAQFLLYQLLFPGTSPQLIAELGSGLGELSRRLALVYPDSNIWAVDQGWVSLLSTGDAPGNVRNLSLHHADEYIAEAQSVGRPFDLVYVILPSPTLVESKQLLEAALATVSENGLIQFMTEDPSIAEMARDLLRSRGFGISSTDLPLEMLHSISHSYSYLLSSGHTQAFWMTAVRQTATGRNSAGSVPGTPAGQRLETKGDAKSGRGAPTQVLSMGSGGLTAPAPAIAASTRRKPPQPIKRCKRPASLSGAPFRLPAYHARMAAVVRLRAGR
ncbi:MAG: class I SAM-dependent methyltransferase [Deltaproteobacteria bacterium]|nr:class I SAM-dependent methyltransferase [Deltaproteobacteria bacterium]